MMPFRNRLVAIAGAPWLRKVWLYRLLWTIALQFDVLGDWLVFGIKARYPELAPADALPILGRERGIRRGFSETADSYAARLVLWLQSRKFKGGSYAMMDQLAGYLSGYAVTIRVVNLNGAWFTRNPDGSRDYSLADPTNWEWDSSVTRWARYWVVIYPDASLWTDEGTFGDDQYWGDGGQIGSTISQDQADTLLAIIAEWNPPHAYCSHLILDLGGTLLPTADDGHPMPTTDWESWAAYDPYKHCVGTRLRTARYCLGIVA